MSGQTLHRYYWVECPECDGSGRHYAGHPNDPWPRDVGSCERCDGSGKILEKVVDVDENP